MNIFLRAKHWQIFLIVFALPMVLYIVMFMTMITSMMNTTAPNPAAMLSMFKWFPVLIVIIVGTLLAWEWSIAMGLQKFVPADVKMKASLFKVFFFVPVIYFILLGIFMSFVFSNMLASPANGIAPAQPPAALMVGMVFIIPLHFFSIFCLFYIVFFAAKTLKSVELQREASFSDFVGEFFCILFYFVGVWIIQPRINKLYNNGAPSVDLADDYVPPISY